MKAPFRLHERKVSHETVAYYRQMLTLAEAGEILGGAEVVMFKNREFMTATFGEADRNPVFARGMVCVLDDQLALKIKS